MVWLVVSIDIHRLVIISYIRFSNKILLILLFKCNDRNNVKYQSWDWKTAKRIRKVTEIEINASRKWGWKEKDGTSSDVTESVYLKLKINAKKKKEVVKSDEKSRTTNKESTSESITIKNLSNIGIYPSTSNLNVSIDQKEV